MTFYTQNMLFRHVASVFVWVRPLLVESLLPTASIAASFSPHIERNKPLPRRLHPASWGQAGLDGPGKEHFRVIGEQVEYHKGNHSKGDDNRRGPSCRCKNALSRSKCPAKVFFAASAFHGVLSFDSVGLPREAPSLSCGE